MPISLQFDKLYTNLTTVQQLDVSNKIREFYFGNREISEETRQQLTNMYSDRLFNHGVRACALLMAEHVPVFTYQFAHNRGDYSIMKLYGIDKILGRVDTVDRLDGNEIFLKMFSFQVFLMLTKFHFCLLNHTDLHPSFRRIQPQKKFRNIL